MVELFTHKYPYTDFHELNLDWIISKVIQMDTKLTNFVSLNTIKYADPIGWDITTQYGTNTVVMDQATGIAYISSQPVPAGVSIGDTDYWSVIFDLQAIIGNITDNLTFHNNGSSPTLLGDVNEGDWILWNNALYVATVNMIAGTALIEGSNVEKASVEDLTKSYTDALAALVGLLSDLQTSDTSSIVNAINSVLSDIGTIIGNLIDLTTTDKSSIVNAINEVVGSVASLSLEVGDLANLTTTDKTSIVNSINEVVNHVNSIKTIYVNVKDYGATGDGVTDDTAAINDALAVAQSYDLGATLFFPAGEYLISNTITIPYVSGHGLGGVSILGEGRYSSVIFTNLDIDLIQYIGGGLEPDDSDSLFGVGVQDIYLRYLGGNSNHTGISFSYCHQIFMKNVRVRYFKTGVFLAHTGNSSFYNVGISCNVQNGRGFDVGDRSVSNSYISCFFAASGDAVGLNNGAVGFWASRGNISDQNIIYFDCGGSCVEAVHIDGSNTVTNQTGDINIIDLVCETYYGVVLYNMNKHGNVNIIGGWFNCTGERAGIYLTSSNGVSVN
ncbi:MAG: hypothetical protein IKY14_04550, partial [Erysipelotrichaceae bacterium]|nr:hypothetical protein [Erysipelotrichaceae bacterium]